MRLFGTVNGRIDRQDRAGWFMRRFDLRASNLASAGGLEAAGPSTSRITIETGSAARAGLAAGSAARSGLKGPGHED